MVPPVARATLASAAPPAPLERRETPARTVLLAPTAPQDPRVWPGRVVSWVCPDSVEREASPACLDLLASLVNKDLLAVVETEDPPDP